ncbi:hypothetical protein HF086_001780 [Spodoptera exigua]|uniref:Uncharacterized protein n=1 Tax=Spodoptera exigua TaxID=7107 RepID=A0A922MFX5_SPOEX|nr:hypothetical protein HF086_001780 [Spodoptera exigua]
METSCSHAFGGQIETNKLEETYVQVSAPTTPLVSVLKKPVATLTSRSVDAKIAAPIKDFPEPFYPVKLDSIKQLKDSTKKLLCLLEDIQAKTNLNTYPKPDASEVRLVQLPTDDVWMTNTYLNAETTEQTQNKFETQTKALNTIYIEGLADSAYAEKVEITQGCSHSDMCNVFEDHSIVTTCISWPCKLEYYGDTVTQNLAASFLYKLAQLEEGRRYLKFTSKVTNDIKKVLRKRGSKLDRNTVELLHAALNAMHPPMTQHVNGTYQYRHLDEGYGNENYKALLEFRAYMSIDEVFTHLELLNNLSGEEKGKMELKNNLSSMLQLFKDMLQQYDNSEMNIIITNILNNIVSKTMLQEKKESDWPKPMIVANIATEPIKVKNEIIQLSPLSTPPQHYVKKHNKKSNKSRNYLNRGHKHKDSGGPAALNKSKKLIKDRRPIIVVPVEKK